MDCTGKSITEMVKVAGGRRGEKNKEKNGSAGWEAGEIERYDCGYGWVRKERWVCLVGGIRT